MILWLLGLKRVLLLCVRGLVMLMRDVPLGRLFGSLLGVRVERDSSCVYAGFLLLCTLVALWLGGCGVVGGMVGLVFLLFSLIVNYYILLRTRMSRGLGTSVIDANCIRDPLPLSRAGTFRAFNLGGGILRAIVLYSVRSFSG